MVTEVYTFTVAPDYTIARYTRGMTQITMEEWTGRSLEDFAAGMKGRGFRYHTEDASITGKTRTDHVWTRDR